MARSASITGNDSGTQSNDRTLLQALPSMFAERVLPASFFLLVALGKVNGLLRFVAVPQTTADWLARGGFYATCIAKFATIVFLLLLVACFVVRINAVRTARHPVQIIVALLGTFSMTIVALAGQTLISPVLAIVSATIMIAGSIVTLIALRFLGRSFSLTPEARRLVTGGLYSVVRHPMYMGEMLGSLGLLLQALSPLTIGVFVIFCILQVKRMDYEERILELAFPDYQLYKRHTARLIPGLY